MKERIARPRLGERNALLLLEDVLKEAVRTGKLRTLLQQVFPRDHRADIAQRLRIAQLLVAGYSYRGIEDATRASAKTIAIVDRWLRSENPRYRKLFPIRHKRQYLVIDDFPDTALAWPGSVRGQIAALFGADPRQR